MASLFKPKRVEYTLDGKHRLSNGRRVTAKTPGAVRSVVVSPKWYGRFTDGNGKQQRVPLSESKDLARRMLAKLAGDAQLAGVGLTDPFEAHRGRPLAEHLEDYRRHLLSGDAGEKYVHEVHFRAKTIIDACKARVVEDLEPSAVAEALAELRKRDRGGNPKLKTGRKGFGVKTSNHYLGAIKQLTKWMVRDRRIPFDPLATLGRLNATIDVRVDRRTLPPDQFATLIEAARAGIEVDRLTGADRATIYLLAAYTGLRCGEVASLKPADFDLDATPPTVTTRASYRGNKAKKTVTLPLQVEVADLLRVRVAGLARDSLIWPGSWRHDGARMLRKDLAAAGIPYTDADGRQYDFHALRHQFITNLAMGGVSPKEAQDLARHSDIRLTMNAYTHLGLHDLAAALEKLPPVPGATPKAKKGNRRA